MKKCLCMLMCLLMMLSTLTVSAEPQDSLENLDIVITLGETATGNVKVTLHDERGSEVWYWPVTLEIDGEAVQTLYTDADAIAEFDYAVPEDAMEASVTAGSAQVGDYWMVGTTAYIKRDPLVTTSPEDDPSEDTTTTTTTGIAATTTTTAVQSANTTVDIGGPLTVSPMTTVANGNRVAIGVDIDDALANAFGAAPSEILSRACMWMDKADYDALVSLPTATVHLEMVYDEESSAHTEWFTAAKNASSRYSSYEDDEVKGFAINMDLVYIDGNARVPLENLKETLGDFQCDVQIPVPQSLSGCKELAISVCTSNGLTELRPVAPNDGVILLKLQAFQRLAIIGFGTQTTSVANSPWAFLSSLGDVPVAIIIIFIVGILLVVGGILIMVFVTFRRKKKTASADNNSKKDDSHRVMLEPIDDDVELGQPPVMRYDMSSHDVEKYRANPKMDQADFKRISEQSVSPAKQINDRGMNEIRQSIKAESAADNQQPLTVDDVLGEVMSDLEDLDTE